MKCGQIYYPPFNNLNRDICCVYRINFICGFYYIGSTACLYNRLYSHKTFHNPRNKRYQYQNVLTWKDVVSVEVLAVGDIGKMRVEEKRLIGEVCNNHPCLNVIRQMGGRVIQDSFSPILD